MKRLIAMLLALVCLPLAALAAPDTPYAPDTVMPVSTLSAEALALVDILYPAIRGCEEEIELPPNTLYDDANAAAEVLIRDYPELFHVEKQWSVSYYQTSPEYATRIHLSYRMSVQEYEWYLAQLMTVAQDAVDRTAGLPEPDRAEALHDWLCSVTAYDHDATEATDNTAVGALLIGMTLCDGYAQGLTLLYRLAGIPCGVVWGELIDGENVFSHGWNVATIAGAPTLIDATQDDSDRYSLHWYYGLTTDMMSADHIPYPEMTVPVCDSTAVNWHARRGLLVSDGDDLLAAIREFAVNGEADLRFADRALYLDFMQRMHDWFGQYNARCASGEEINGSFGYVYDEYQCGVYLYSADGGQR